MSEDALKDKAPAATPPEPTDAELEGLKLQKAKQTLRQDIAATQAAALASLGPSVADAPKGEVTLGANSGSLGPWLAHKVLAGAGEEIATSVKGLDLATGSVVLVTDDAELLVSDVLSLQVLKTMSARTTELGQVKEQVATALSTLEDDIATYTELEMTPASGTDEEVETRKALAAEAFTAILAAMVALPTDATKAAGTDSTEGAAGDKKEEPKKEETPAAGAGGATAGGGPLSVAVDLIRLLATDFTLTSVKVTAGSATLATVTAGALATEFGPAPAQNQQPTPPTGQTPPPTPPTGQTPPPTPPAGQTGKYPAQTVQTPPGQVQAPVAPTRRVVLDGFTVTPSESATLTKYEALTQAAYETSLEVQKLRSKAAGVASEAAEYKAAADKLQTAWTAATTKKDAAPGSADKLKAALDEVTARVNRRTRAAAAAQSAADSAASIVTSARTDLSALTTADTKGVIPLIRACSREGLHADPATVTHILLVEATNAGADIVTRRSVLGTSARVGYLAGTNTTWALAEVATGALRGGGANNPAWQMTHDLTTGNSISSEITPGGTLGEDPLAKNEGMVRIGVLILALGIALLGVAAVVNVVTSLF